MSTTPVREPRNLVVCCDGTGNVWKPGPGKTNVVKLVESLIRDPGRQLYYYDPGVGTPDGYVSEAGQAWRDLIRRLGGLVWGEGVWANVAGAYSFLVHNYHPGDRIYFFGFSRGAFTARATASLVDLFGVLRREHENLIPTLLKVYRSKPKSKSDARSQSAGVAESGAGIESASRPAVAAPPATAPAPGALPAKATRRDIGDSLRDAFSHDERTLVHFVGVWDTVESVGLTQLALGTNITSNPTVKPAYCHVRHALALDELRWPYEPRLYYDPKFADEERSFKQVWFAGAHSDVGGGYAEAGVANATLHWMLREASKHGLLIDFDVPDAYPINVLDRLHNETAKLPLWVSVGAFRRTYPERMCVHKSVIERMRTPGTRYAPNLPADHSTESTSDEFVDASGATVRRPPAMAPQVLGAPVKDGWRAWHIAWLLASSLATWWAFSRYRADELALAAMQFFDARVGGLYQAIGEFHPVSGKSVETLLLADTIAVICYATLLPILAFLLLRFAGRDGAARPILGKVFCYSTGFLPAADLAENLLTWLTLHHEAWRPLWGYATFAASCAKYALLAAFAVAAIGCVLSWFVRRLGQGEPVLRAAA